MDNIVNKLNLDKAKSNMTAFVRAKLDQLAQGKNIDANNFIEGFEVRPFYDDENRLVFELRLRFRESEYENQIRDLDGRKAEIGLKTKFCPHMVSEEIQEVNELCCISLQNSILEVVNRINDQTDINQILDELKDLVDKNKFRSVDLEKFYLQIQWDVKTLLGDVNDSIERGLYDAAAGLEMLVERLKLIINLNEELRHAMREQLMIDQNRRELASYIRSDFASKIIEFYGYETKNEITTQDQDSRTYEKVIDGYLKRICICNQETENNSQDRHEVRYHFTAKVLRDDSLDKPEKLDDKLRLNRAQKIARITSL